MLRGVKRHFDECPGPFLSFLAQSVEQWPVKPEVVGSIPPKGGSKCNNFFELSKIKMSDVVPSAKQIEEDKIAIKAYNDEIEKFNYESKRNTDSLVGLSLGGLAMFLISAFVAWNESTGGKSTGTLETIAVLIMLFGAPLTWGLGISETKNRYNNAKDSIKEYNSTNDPIMLPIFERAAKNVNLYEPPKEKVILLQKKVDDADDLYNTRLLAINIVGGIFILIFLLCLSGYNTQRGQLKTAAFQYIDSIKHLISNLTKAAYIFGLSALTLLIFGNIFATSPSKKDLNNKKKELNEYKIKNAIELGL